MIHDIRHRLRALFGRGRVERDVDDEIGLHVDMQVRRYEADGWPPAAARRQARLDIGGADQVKEAHRDARGTRVLEDLWRDARVAVRVLGRAPLFAMTAVATVALGVGINTLVFSVFEGLVLRPLPIEQPERVWFVQREGGGVSHSFPFYRVVRDENRTFAGVAGYRVTVMSVETRQGPRHAWGYLVTGSYFDVLGVEPRLGRLFHEADDVAPGASPFAVLSYDYWERAFDSDPGIVGTTIRVNRLPFTVLGVAPRGFHGTEVFYRPAIWVPMMMQAQIEVGNPWLDNPMTWNTWIVGRLAEGVTPAQAAGDLDRLAEQAARELGPATAESGRFRLARPGLMGDVIGGPARRFGVGLLLLAGLVLVAACANLAGGIAARGADRTRELAVRVAVGAGRARLVRQLLTETLVLVVAGGAVGTGAAAVAARALAGWQLPIAVPIQVDTAVDMRVALFALAATLLTAVGIGLGPALQAARTDPHASLRVRDETAGGRRWPVRDLLVAAQVAISVALVAGSVAAGRALVDMTRMPLGMHPEGIVTTSFDLGQAGYSRQESDALRAGVLEALDAYPGVRAAAYGNSFPLSIDYSTSRVYADGRPPPAPADTVRAGVYQVSPGYFDTLEIRLVGGRDIAWSDTAGRPLVAVVNEAFVSQVLGGEAPIGKRVRFGPGGDGVTVVGVVETGKYQTLAESPTPAIFEPMLQSPNTTTVVFVRSSRPDGEMAGVLQRVVRNADPKLPIIDTRSLDEALTLVRLPVVSAALALGAFGLLAAVLAATGLHGIVAYAVSRRRRELAIRVALGASRGGVVRLVLGRTSVLVMLGLAGGVMMAALLGSVLASVLYMPVTPSAGLWAVVVGLVALVSTAACAWPTWQAVRVAPAETLAVE